jgi:hypothetical protein
MSNDPFAEFIMPAIGEDDPFAEFSFSEEEKKRKLEEEHRKITDVSEVMKLTETEGIHREEKIIDDKIIPEDKSDPFAEFDEEGDPGNILRWDPKNEKWYWQDRESFGDVDQLKHDPNGRAFYQDEAGKKWFRPKIKRGQTEKGEIYSYYLDPRDNKKYHAYTKKDKGIIGDALDFVGDAAEELVDTGKEVLRVAPGGKVLSSFTSGLAHAAAQRANEVSWLVGKALDIASIPASIFTGEGPTVGDTFRESFAKPLHNKLSELAEELDKQGLGPGIIDEVVTGLGSAVIDIPILMYTQGAFKGFNFAAHGFVNAMSQSDDDLEAGVRGAIAGGITQGAFHLTGFIGRNIAGTVGKAVGKVFGAPFKSLGLAGQGFMPTTGVLAGAGMFATRQAGQRIGAGLGMGAGAHISGILEQTPITGQTTISSIITGVLFPTGIKRKQVRDLSNVQKEIERIDKEFGQTLREFSESDGGYRDFRKIGKAIDRQVKAMKDMFDRTLMPLDEMMVRDHYGRLEAAVLRHSVESRFMEGEVAKVAKQVKKAGVRVAVDSVGTFEEFFTMKFKMGRHIQEAFRNVAKVYEKNPAEAIKQLDEFIARSSQMYQETGGKYDWISKMAEGSQLPEIFKSPSGSDAKAFRAGFLERLGSTLTEYEAAAKSGKIKVNKKLISEAIPFLAEMPIAKKKGVKSKIDNWSPVDRVRFRVAEMIERGEMPGHETIKNLVEDMRLDYSEYRSLIKSSGIKIGFKESYFNRAMWDSPETTQAAGKYAGQKKNIWITTSKAKHRTFDTIIEALNAGYTRTEADGIELTRMYKDEAFAVSTNRKFVDAAFDAQVFSLKEKEGYIPLDETLLKRFGWFAKSAKPGQRSGKHVVQSGENIFAEKTVYAPEHVAKWLSKINENAPPGIISKIADSVKSSLFVASLFHSLAFTRSYFYGASEWNPKNWNPLNVYKEAKRLVTYGHPLIEAGIRHGQLTLGRVNEWSKAGVNDTWGKLGQKLRNIASEKLSPEAAVRANKAIDNVGRAFSWWTEFTFGTLGAGLKSKAFAIKVRDLAEKHHHLSAREIFTIAGKLINDDFGGLNLRQMNARGNKAQRAIRNAFLAPDWTESNVRTIVKMSGLLNETLYPKERHMSKAAAAAEAQAYRGFWSQALIKGTATMAAANLLIQALFNGKDAPVEYFKEKWDEGGLGALYEFFTDVDITPAMETLGTETDGYTIFLDGIGHFGDPLKWLGAKTGDPVRSMVQALRNKSSWPVQRTVSLITGKNWRGWRFRELEDVLESPEEGLTGFEYGGEGMSASRFPAYVTDTLTSALPIPAQAGGKILSRILAHTFGEAEGIQDIAALLGVRVRVKD